jgi:hypothetical protein
MGRFTATACGDAGGSLTQGGRAVNQTISAPCVAFVRKGSEASRTHVLAVELKISRASHGTEAATISSRWHDNAPRQDDLTCRASVAPRAGRSARIPSSAGRSPMYSAAQLERARSCECLGFPSGQRRPRPSRLPCLNCISILPGTNDGISCRRLRGPLGDAARDIAPGATFAAVTAERMSRAFLPQHTSAAPLARGRFCFGGIGSRPPASCQQQADRPHDNPEDST